jgi:hypothetical protein
MYRIRSQDEDRAGQCQPDRVVTYLGAWLLGLRVMAAHETAVAADDGSGDHRPERRVGVWGLYVM